MANKRVFDVPELTTPAIDDYINIIDVSDLTESTEGTLKKIKKTNLIGASVGILGFIDYPKITVAGTQNFTIPVGTVAVQVFNNKTQYFKETANNSYQVDTFTQVSNIVSLKKNTVVGNYICIIYQYI